MLVGVDMSLRLHFVCKQGMNHKKIGDQLFETGNWSVTEKLAEESIGGKIFLHEKQDAPAWHGGTITAWRHAGEEGRIIFTFYVDAPFRIKCTENWGREKAILRNL